MTSPLYINHYLESIVWTSCVPLLHHLKQIITRSQSCGLPVFHDFTTSYQQLPGTNHRDFICYGIHVEFVQSSKERHNPKHELFEHVRNRVPPSRPNSSDTVEIYSNLLFAWCQLAVYSEILISFFELGESGAIPPWKCKNHIERLTINSHEQMKSENNWKEEIYKDYYNKT